MIRFTSIAITLGGLLSHWCPRVLADSPTPLLRLAVVDDSGSMEGQRAETVRAELLKVSRQLPPSLTHPFGIITFGSTAATVRWFTDLPSFERAVTGLDGNSGGTNIAAGLQEAAKALRSRTDSASLCILLYTDGEDGNTAGILQAESQLDAIFAQRQQVGLSQ
ncbi:MAG: VWA domain-containing protein, partial [Planctomycetaceae bacterium]|nr:VWA domain-containing protein [Planctomycetaceae bacterium]